MKLPKYKPYKFRGIKKWRSDRHKAEKALLMAIGHCRDISGMISVMRVVGDVILQVWGPHA